MSTADDSNTTSGSNQLVDLINSLLDHPRVAYFVYYSVLVATGLFLLRQLASQEYPFGQSLVYMGLYLFLFIMLEPPEAAQLESKPFDDPDVLP